MVDSLKFYEILKAGHLPDDHARAMKVAIQSAETQINADFKATIHEEFELFEQRFDLKLAEAKAEMMRWMFIFWVSQFTATVGLVIAVLTLAK